MVYHSIHFYNGVMQHQTKRRAEDNCKIGKDGGCAYACSGQCVSSVVVVVPKDPPRCCGDQLVLFAG
jgi:hypothetical protein